MGVTLERVQNKFACIIGELCSEPDILSEFAIWLDLRLAEYKAKGAIQLECSGEMPDPSWLRGHKKPSKRQKSPPTELIQHYDSTQQYIEDVPQDVSERLSPDIVVIKDEPSESTDVFPVNIYCHENSPDNRSNSRKRLSNDGSSIGHLDKMPRLSPSTSVLEPVNQSLMSIIRENTADDFADMTANVSADFSNIETSIKEENSTFLPSSDPSPSTSSSKSSNKPDGSNPDGWSKKARGKTSEKRKAGTRLYWQKIKQNETLYQKKLEINRLRVKEYRLKLKDAPAHIKEQLREANRERQRRFRQKAMLNIKSKHHKLVE